MDNPHKDKFGNTPYSEKFMEEECACILHEVGQIWRDQTEAFVTDAERVYSPAGACRYLAKYLVKGFIDRERLKELGFARRYSMARNWDRGERIQLRGSKEEIWESTEVLPRWYRDEELRELQKLSEKAYYIESVGDPVSLEIVAKARRRSELKKVENIKNAIFPSFVATQPNRG